MRQVANVVNQVANAGRTALLVTHDPNLFYAVAIMSFTSKTGKFRKVIP